MLMRQTNPFNYIFYMLTIFVVSSILFLIGFFPLSTNIIGNADEHYNSVQANKLDEYMYVGVYAQTLQLLFIHYFTDSRNLMQNMIKLF